MKLARLTGLIAGTITGLLMPLAAYAASAPAVHEHMLDNGMKIIIKEDHRSPVVVSQVWYKVGASYEYSGITGVSHVLEHMMFKGTEKLAPNEFSKIISANGGRENAFTGRDYTAYFQTLHKDRIEVSFKHESDRMRNLVLKDEEFQKEVKVVMEERRLRTEDKPTSLTYEQFSATAFQTSPYHNPVIGWMNDLENMDLDDLKVWYQKWYAPNNATLVVVGDVDPAHVLELAKKYYGPLKPSKIKPLKPRIEVEQKGQRRVSVKAPAEVPYVIMGYRVPVLKTAKEDWEPYALDMLANVLDGGSSARFSKEIVRGKQIAVSAGAGYDLYTRMDSMFLLDGSPAQGKKIEDVEKALRKQVARLHKEKVKQAELDRIKAQVVASKVYELDSVFYQGMKIGTMETVGLDWRKLDEYVDRIKAVTPEQIQQVAQKYLVDDRLTVAVLDPQPLDNKKPRPAGGSNAKH